MKTGPNITNVALKEVWSWHSISKIHKITVKSGLKFDKPNFLWVSHPNCLQMFLSTSEITKFDKVLNLEKVYTEVLLLPLRKINWLLRKAWLCGHLEI